MSNCINFMGSLCGSACVAFAVALPANANNMDGVATVSNELHAHLYSYANKSEPLDQPVSAKIAHAIVVDKALSTDERDLLLELKRSDIDKVTISSPSGTVSTVPVATPAGAQIFDYIMAAEKFDALQKWQGGAEGLAFLGIHYHVYPATQNHIINAISKDLVAASRASNVNNAFEPLRTYLEGYRKDIKTLPKFERAAASQMMYDIVTRLNARRAEGRKIPGFIYSDFDNRRYRDLLP